MVSEYLTLLANVTWSWVEWPEKVFEIAECGQEYLNLIIFLLN